MPFESSKHEEQPFWPGSSNTGSDQGAVGRIRTHPLGSRPPDVVGYSHQQSRPRGTMPRIPIPIPIPNDILDVNGGSEDVKTGDCDWPSMQQPHGPFAYAYPHPFPLPPSLPYPHAHRELDGSGTVDRAGLAAAAGTHWAQHVFQARVPLFLEGSGSGSARPYPVADDGFRHVIHDHDPHSMSLVDSTMSEMLFLEGVRSPDGNEMVPAGRRIATTILPGPSQTVITGPSPNAVSGDPLAQPTDEDWAPFRAMWLATAPRYAQVEVALDLSVNHQPYSEQVHQLEDDHDSATTNELLDGSSRDNDYSESRVDVTVAGTMAGDDRVLNGAALGHMAPAFFANALGLDFSVPAPPPQPVYAHAHPQPRHQRPRPRPRAHPRPRAPPGPARDHSHPAECPSCGRVPTDADLGEWRMGLVSLKMVCNACGQYERRTGRVRPRELETIRRRGNGVRVYSGKTQAAKSGME